MAAGKPFKDGPSYLTNSAANVYNETSTALYTLIRHIHLANSGAAANVVHLYVGATGGSTGGTELLQDYSIAAGDVFDLYFPAGLKLVSTDFLTGFAGVTNEVIITVSGELYVA